VTDLPLSRVRTAESKAPARPSQTARTILALDSAAGRPWFLPAVSLFPLTDYVLPFLPNQMLLVALSILQPRRWWVFAMTFVIATALGALLTAYAIEAIGPWVLDNLVGGAPEQGVVANVLHLVEDYGLWALAALAMLPWPPRTGVIVCALAGLPAPLIGLAVALGRVVPAGAYTLVGSRSPHLLRRFRRIDRVMKEVESLRTA
jgi:hypothetical protein